MDMTNKKLHKDIHHFDDTNQKKILMIADVYLQIAANHRFYHLVKYFSKKIEHVDFVNYANLYGGPPTSLLKKIIKSIHNLLFDRRQVYKKGNIRYVVIRKMKLPQFLQYLIGDLWVYVNLPKWLKNNNYKFCLYSLPHNFFLVSLLKRCKAFEKVFYDDCDFMPDGPGVKGRASRFTLAWKERLAVTKADGVISVSYPLAALRKNQGAKKVIVVPNGVDLEHFLEARQKEIHPPSLVYMGLLSDAWEVDLALEALPLIKKVISNIRFLIIGRGEKAQKLMDLAVKLGVKNETIFLGKQPHHKLSKYLKQADVGVAIFKDRKFNKYACHLKIREYMAAGLPVIVSKIGEGEQVIKESEAGALVDNSPESVASAAIKILTDQDLRKKFSENSVRYAANFEWSIILEKVFKFIASN